MYCYNCGKEVDEKAVVCIHCGCALSNPNQQIQRVNRSKGIASMILSIIGIIYAFAAFTNLEDLDFLYFESDNYRFTYAISVILVQSIFAIIAICMTPSNPIVALIGFILAGAMLAFLTYNFNPAKIFMGDSGALFSGFLLATISIVGVMKAATLTLLLPFVVLAVPIMDIVFSSTRRICKGKSPFVADAEHIHHKLLHAGFSQKKTVLILTSVAIIAGAIASLIMGENTIKHYAVCILIVIFIMLLLNFIKVLTKK